MRTAYTSIIAIVLCFFTPFGETSYAKGDFALFIFDFDGKGDDGFDKSASMGIERVRKELKVGVKEYEPRGVKKARAEVREAIKNGTKLIISLGFRMASVIEKVAKDNPNSHFVIIDAIVDLPNVASYVFNEQEGSFLAGYMAAKFSKSQSVGYIGGAPIPPLKRFESGFVQGARYALPKIQIAREYIDNNPKNSNVWNNAPKAKRIARNQFSKGADVIFAVAGGSGTGVFIAAKEVQKHAIGVDINQNPEMPGRVLTSMVKRVDNAVFNAVQTSLSGKFQSGQTVLGLKEGGVGLAIDHHTKKLVSEQTLNEIKALSQKIKEGSLPIKKNLSH